VSDVDRVLAEFLRGQLMVMLVLAVYYAVALTLVGLERGGAIGVLTGLLVFIPYVGYGLGLVLGVLSALLQWSSWGFFIAVLAVYAIGQLLEAYVLVPYLVGDRIGLHPLAVIFALLAFGQLFGFAGVLLHCPRRRCCWSGCATCGLPISRLRCTAKASRTWSSSPSSSRRRSRRRSAISSRAATRKRLPSSGRSPKARRARRCCCFGGRRVRAVPTFCRPRSRRRQAGDHRATARARAPTRCRARPPGPSALVAVDDVDRADAAAQGRLFTLYNRLQDSGGQLLVAAAAPPGQLPLRDDLRSRLGWGLVYEVLPLPDDDKPQALAGYARERGFRLGDDVIAYLLSHGRRDMPTLVATLAALDRYSLASKRPVTVPLLGSGSSAPWRSGEARNDRIPRFGVLLQKHGGSKLPGDRRNSLLVL
jgi:hypothetical protein